MTTNVNQMSYAQPCNFEIENHLYVDKSVIAGAGLFTSKSFRQGEVVFVMKGPKIHFKPKNKAETMATPNIVGIDDGVYMDPCSPYVFINHSCEPNLVAAEDAVSYVALRAIQAGEELTFDYSTSEYSDWEMPCSCGTTDCRRVIRSIDKLPRSVFEKYFPNIPRYFQNIFIKKYIEKNK